jgi:GDPmannose 4,6-dehydratase
MKRALITGITGQDGSYLAELLLQKGYEVHGLVRRVSTGGTWRIDPFKEQLVLHEGDLLERGSISRLLKLSNPDELYNLAAMSFVHASFQVPEYTGEADGLAVTRLLEAIRDSDRPVRFYQASTSEMFGISPPPQNELTRLHPRSPYAAAKCYGHHITVNYRESYGMHASCGILFNHESPRRGEEFVTRKIARGAARIHLGLDRELRLGNLDAKRDWGHAREYVEAMWLMLQQEEPADYVIATGETHAISTFAQAAFSRLGLDWQDHVKTDPRLLRPAEVFDLRGDSSRARTRLGWKPTVTFEQLVHEMVDAEVERATLIRDGSSLASR